MARTYPPITSQSLSSLSFFDPFRCGGTPERYCSCPMFLQYLAALLPTSTQLSLTLSYLACLPSLSNIIELHGAMYSRCYCLYKVNNIHPSINLSMHLSTCQAQRLLRSVESATKKRLKPLPYSVSSPALIRHPSIFLRLLVISSHELDDGPSGRHSLNSLLHTKHHYTESCSIIISPPFHRIAATEYASSFPCYFLLYMIFRTLHGFLPLSTWS